MPKQQSEIARKGLKYVDQTLYAVGPSSLRRNDVEFRIPNRAAKTTRGEQACSLQLRGRERGSSSILGPIYIIETTL